MWLTKNELFFLTFELSFIQKRIIVNEMNMSIISDISLILKNLRYLLKIIEDNGNELELLEYRTDNEECEYKFFIENNHALFFLMKDSFLSIINEHNKSHNKIRSVEVKIKTLNSLIKKFA